jgi:glycosyltransferase involved in cell wall biosynthesis
MPWVRKERVHAILNGIDTKRFADAVPVDARSELGLPEDTALIGFFGRFMAPKGFRTLVDAVEILVREDFPRPLRVVTFGWGGFIREDYRYLSSKGLDTCFIQRPHTDEPERWMKALDVVAMPSRSEACPLVAMEALAAGAPIVGTTCIGLREVLEGTPGRAVPPDNGQALARALREILLSPSQGETSSAYREEAVARFDVRASAFRLRQLYDKTAAGK